jgi:hypothetical protein
MALPRVDSTASELNDFSENKEGKKEYQVNVQYFNMNLLLLVILQVSKSRLVRLINWVHVSRLYLPIIWFIIIGVLSIQVFSTLYEHRFDFKVSLLHIYVFLALISFF